VKGKDSVAIPTAVARVSISSTNEALPIVTIRVDRSQDRFVRVNPTVPKLIRKAIGVFPPFTQLLHHVVVLSSGNTLDFLRRTARGMWIACKDSCLAARASLSHACFSWSSHAASPKNVTVPYGAPQQRSIDPQRDYPRGLVLGTIAVNSCSRLAVCVTQVLLNKDKSGPRCSQRRCRNGTTLFIYNQQQTRFLYNARHF
jgi:hypothetical protein